MSGVVEREYQVEYVREDGERMTFDVLATSHYAAAKRAVELMQEHGHVPRGPGELEVIVKILVAGWGARDDGRYFVAWDRMMSAFKRETA